MNTPQPSGMSTVSVTWTFVSLPTSVPSAYSYFVDFAARPVRVATRTS
ncbi:MAG: hypothetical protein M0D55_11100 [Elusimicrobiota bacterium]|nr:MAG: hypothetical protein M0D55_11100 [Elusimicrobiota bacterium]